MADDRDPFSESDPPGTESGEAEEVDGIPFDFCRKSGDATERLHDEDGNGKEKENDPRQQMSGILIRCPGRSGEKDQGKKGLKANEEHHKT